MKKMATFIRKAADHTAFHSDLNNQYGTLSRYKITETAKDFHDFENHFFASRDWLKGKGGYDIETDTRYCVEVRCADKVWIVDPQGYDYARYTAKPNL